MSVDERAERADVIDDTRGGFVMGHQDRLDGPFPISAQCLCDPFRIDTLVQGKPEPLNAHPQPFRDGCEPLAEHPGGQRQDVVPRCKGVYEGYLQPAGSGAGKEEHVPRGLKDLLQALSDVYQKILEFRPPAIYHLSSHGPEHPEGDEDRSRQQETPIFL